MKTFSKLALAVALTSSTAGVLTTVPAVAKDKKEDAKPGLKLSPDILKAAQGAQTALAAKDVATAEPLIAQVEAGGEDPRRQVSGGQFPAEPRTAEAAGGIGGEPQRAAGQYPADRAAGHR